MGRIECESFGFDCPYFADVFEGCEALEGLEAFGINPGGAWVITSGGANTAGIRGLNPA